MAVVPIYVDGLNFRRSSDNSIWKWHGICAFTGLQDFINGDFTKLDAYAAWCSGLGVEVWRCLGMWSVTGFNVLTIADYYTQMADFCTWLSDRGFYLHYVALTDQYPGNPVFMTDAEQDAHVAAAVAVSVAAGNVFFEIMNEPPFNGGYTIPARFDPSVFTGVLTTRGMAYDGDPNDAPGSLLDFTTQHTLRTQGNGRLANGDDCIIEDWVRKCRLLFDISRLDTPHTDKPPIAGEPMGIGEVNEPGRRSNNAEAFAEYHAGVDLFGCGGNLHGGFATLQQCIVPPGALELACADAVANVWATAGIPLDANETGAFTRGGFGGFPLVHFDRFDESGFEVNPNGSIRSQGMLQGSNGTIVIIQPGADWSAIGDNGWIVTSVHSVGEIVFVELATPGTPTMWRSPGW